MYSNILDFFFLFIITEFPLFKRDDAEEIEDMEEKDESEEKERLILEHIIDKWPASQQIGTVSIVVADM